MQFSIIVPIYNIEQYIEKCVESVLCQSFKDYELILINDGSVDRSAEIIDKYAEKYDCIRVIHKSNGGLSDARNVGIGRALGEYILFLDGDDYWLESSFLEKLSYYITVQKEPVDIVAFDGSFVFTDGYKKSLVNEKINMFKPIKQCEDSEKILIEFLSNNLHFGWYSWLYAIRKEVLTQNRLEFPVGRVFEDFYFTWRLLLSAKTIGVLEGLYYAYRINRPGSIVYTKTYRNASDFIWIIEENLKDIGGVVKNHTLEQLLKDSFSTGYLNICSSMYGKLNYKDRKLCYKLLKEKQYLMEYITKPEYVLVCKIIKIMGLRWVLMMFRLRLKLREYYNGSVFRKNKT